MEQLKNHKLWRNRNKYCQKMIQYMRKHNICATYQTGEYKDCLSKHEMKLLLFSCSTMGRSELLQAINTTQKKMKKYFVN